MLSAFGVEHGEVSKLFGRYYHATSAPLKRGDKVISLKAQKRRNDHPKGEEWRSDRVWVTNRKRDARKWAGAGSKTYRVKPNKDKVKHKPNDYDRLKFKSYITSRTGLIPGTVTRRQKKAASQFHARDATVIRVPGEKSNKPIVIGTGVTAGGAGFGAAKYRSKQ